MENSFQKCEIITQRNFSSLKMRATEFYLCFSCSLSFVYLLFSLVHWKLYILFYRLPLHSKSVIVLDNLCVCLAYLSNTSFITFSTLTSSSPVTSLLCYFKHQLPQWHPTPCHHSAVLKYWKNITVSAQSPVLPGFSHCTGTIFTYHSSLLFISFPICFRFHWQPLSDIFSSISLSLSTHLLRKIQF